MGLMDTDYWFPLRGMMSGSAQLKFDETFTKLNPLGGLSAI